MNLNYAIFRSEPIYTLNDFKRCYNRYRDLTIVYIFKFIN